jgi:hypothetical protein
LEVVCPCNSCDIGVDAADEVVGSHQDIAPLCLPIGNHVEVFGKLINRMYGLSKRIMRSRPRVGYGFQPRSLDSENARAAKLETSSRSMKAVEVQIQFQDIDARFAKKSEVAAPCMFLHERANILVLHATRMGNARNLEFSRRGRDVRVQARAGGCHQVNRDRSHWILGAKFLCVGLYALHQELVGRREIRGPRWRSDHTHSLPKTAGNENTEGRRMPAR